MPTFHIRNPVEGLDYFVTTETKHQAITHMHNKVSEKKRVIVEEISEEQRVSLTCLGTKIES